MALALLGAVAVPSPFGLAPGHPIERQMAGGESHSYTIKAAPAPRLLITVEQRGVDVAVEVRRPDGQTLIVIDGPLDRDGPESLLLPAEAAGPFEIQVLSTGPGAAPGSYVIRLEELGAATPAERERLEAERLMTEGAALHREGSAGSRRLAAARYAEARAHWRTLGRRGEEARCAFAAGEIHTLLGEPKPALELYQQALALSAELADEAGQAGAWSGIGSAQTALGDMAGAIESHRHALALESGLGRLHQEAKALNNIGLALHSQGDLRQALSFYEQARAAFDRAGEKGAWAAAVLQNLAAIQIGLGEPAAALASNRQVLELQRALGDRKGEAQTLNNLGVAYDNLGQLGEALEAYESALALFRQSGDQLWEAVLLRNSGLAFYRLGDYERALTALEQALAIFRQAGNRRGEVGAEVSLGYVHLRRGETARAREIGRHAAGVASAGADRQGEMLARRLASEVSLAAGEPAAALAELTRALDLSRALANRLDEASILRLIGRAHLDLEQPDQAVRTLEQAVDLSRGLGNPGRLSMALTALARAHRRLGRPAEARPRVEEALRLIEALRTTESDPDLRASFLASQHAAFELEIALLMELERREPGRGHARAALEVSERARARSLLDLLLEADADIREGVDPVLRDRERALLVRLNAKAGRQAELQRRPADEKRLRAAAEEVRSVLDELARTEAEIRRQSPRYAALTRPSLATSGEIQGLLDEEHDVVESYLRDRLSDRDREAFEAHYFDCEACLAQLELASDFREGMRQVGAEDTARTVAAQAPLGLLAGLALLSRGQRLALAGLFLLLLVLPAGLLVRNRGLERQLAEAQTARPSVPAPAVDADAAARLARFEAELRALREIADGDRRRLAELEGELEKARQAAADRPQAPQVNVPIFMLAAVRSGETDREPVNRVPLPDTTGSVVLALELATVDYPSYRATLRAEGGQEIWQARDLRPDSRDTLVLLLPASMLPPGIYQLTLEGIGNDGRGTAVGAYPFRTVRQP